MTKYTTKYITIWSSEKTIEWPKKYDQNVGCVIRYYKLATNSCIYAKFSGHL